MQILITKTSLISDYENIVFILIDLSNIPAEIRESLAVFKRFLLFLKINTYYKKEQGFVSRRFDIEVI